MTWTVNLIPDDEESCILTASFCCLPLHWKYIFTACMHRNACKGFFRDDFNDLSAYFRREKSIKADQDKADSTVRTMNAESSIASTSTPDTCWGASSELYEEGPSFRSATLPLDNSNKTNFSVSKRSESVSAEGSLAAN
jgi:hypothetical protein